MAKNSNAKSGATSTKAVTPAVAADTTTIVAASPAVVVPAAIAAAPTKADKARAIFAESYAMEVVPARKDILARAVSEAGLTPAGAATYLQNYKDKNHLSVKRAAPTA